MSFEPRDYLRHIAVEADYLIEQSATISAQEFMSDETRRRAFVRSLEIIGEAKAPERRLRHGRKWLSRQAAEWFDAFRSKPAA